MGENENMNKILVSFNKDDRLIEMYALKITEGFLSKCWLKLVKLRTDARKLTKMFTYLDAKKNSFFMK